MRLGNIKTGIECSMRKAMLWCVFVMVGRIMKRVSANQKDWLHEEKKRKRQKKTKEKKRNEHSITNEKIIEHNINAQK